MNHRAENSATLASQPSAVRRPWLLALSFMGGFQIMTLELCGFRVLQMNLGSSVVVTGTLLTTIMAVLSIGYYLGGALSQLRSVRALLTLLATSCVYTHVASVLWLERIADFGLDLREDMWGIDYLEVGIPAGVVSILLYAPPVLVLSMISPCLIHLESEGSAASAGKKSGFFMALSTVGSILGTLIASYVLIPFFGARTTAAASNGLLFGLLCLTWLDSERHIRRMKRAAVAAGALGLALLAVLLPVAKSQFEQNVVHDRDSSYGNIRVIEETDSRGHKFLAYLGSRMYWHSVVYPDEPLRQLNATLYLAPALARATPPRNMLVLGSAAGGVLRSAELLLPNTHITGVDIDPKVHEAAVSVFGVNPEQSKLVSRDARQFVEQGDEQYDFIIVDLFAGEFVPVQCVTRQFFARLKRRLSPDGVMFINTNLNDVPYELPNPDSEPFRTNRHLETTLREAGFASLFENNFFHGLVVYPTEQPLEPVRARWLELSRAPNLPPAARAALGLMAYTTFESATHPRPYRAFSDVWAPDILIERKSNEPALYRALAAATPTAGSAPPANLKTAVFARLVAEQRSAESPGQLVDAAKLVSELEQLAAQPTAADVLSAGRYLRFGYREELPELSPRSAWARLGAGYARMYAAARANDYDAVLLALEDLRTLREELTQKTDKGVKP